MNELYAGPLPFWHRLWMYQAERFPLLKTGLMTTVFAVAMLTLAASLADRAFPPLGAYLVASVVSLLIFFALRVADEFKDAEVDRLYRPERPVPRGLIQLPALGTLGGGAVCVSFIVAGLYEPRLLVSLAVVWLWVGLMALEFFVPAALKARPHLYLISHMSVMPLVGVFFIACAGVAEIPTRLGDNLALLVLAFANGCVLEIGRKLWAPEQEREGVESYSSLWGVGGGALAWAVSLLSAAGAGLWTAVTLGVATVGTTVILLLAGISLLAVWRYAASPTPRTQKQLDAISAIWVLATYSVLALLGLLHGGWPS